MEYIVDKIEAGIAVLEMSGGETFEVPTKYLPEAIREGDVLKLTIDEGARKSRETRIKNLMNRLRVD